MTDFKLKKNEMMFFIDFNNTLVDYEQTYDERINFEEIHRNTSSSVECKIRLTKSLKYFEEKTGITPVICVVTNAVSSVVDANGYQGIFYDLMMTFFAERQTFNNLTPERQQNLIKNSCSKYFRYLIYKDNDHFYKINPFADTLNEMFTQVSFDSKALSINLIPQLKKRESVERMMSLIDPNFEVSKHILFAGDTIKDDYPMKEIATPYGVCKYFIRPGRVHKISPYLMKEFAEAKGEKFSMLSTKTGKKIKKIDSYNFSQLFEEEQNRMKNYHSGDIVLLTDKNNMGLVQGIYKTADLIAEQKKKSTQLGE